MAYSAAQALHCNMTQRQARAALSGAPQRRQGMVVCVSRGPEEKELRHIRASMRHYLYCLRENCAPET